MTAILWVALVACSAPGDPGHEATSVGNPGKMTARTAQRDPVLQEEGTVEVSHLLLNPCDGGPQIRESVQQAVDLVNGTELTLPGGDWCALSLVVDPPFLLEGVVETGAPFRLELNLEEVGLTVSQGFTVDGGSRVLELAAPGWLSLEELVVAAEAREVVDGRHPLHDELVAGLSNGSALFSDSDENGRLDEEERDRGSEARGAARDPGSDPDSGGDTADDASVDSEDTGNAAVANSSCQSGEIETTWLLFSLLCLGRRSIKAGARGPLPKMEPVPGPMAD